MKHQLKTLPAFFQATVDGRKNFEVRWNGDRGFQAGDEVTLLEYDPEKSQPLRYSGREHSGMIGYVLASEMKPGFVVFSLIPFVHARR